jgi:excisionase family DNA binding protein
MESKLFFDVPDIAKRWDVHVNFVYMLIKHGELPCLKIGNAGSKRPVLRVPKTALERWEAQQLAQGAK